VRARACRVCVYYTAVGKNGVKSGEKSSVPIYICMDASSSQQQHILFGILADYLRTYINNIIDYHIIIIISISLVCIYSGRVRNSTKSRYY